MTILGISSPSPYAYQTSVSQQTNAQQMQAFQQNFQVLQQALQSGNLQAAQTAYANLPQNQPNSGSGSSSQNNPFAQALSQIGSALQSGNLSGAQQAMTSVQSQMKAHHHHRQSDGGAPATPSTISTPAYSPPSPITASAPMNRLSSSGAGAASSGAGASAGGDSASGSNGTTTTAVTNPNGTITTTVTNANGTIESITTTGNPAGGRTASGQSGTSSTSASLLNIQA